MSLSQLPTSTIRLLGSAQVITTVSSVVKELMENSFDAGATNVEIRLEKHGLDKIEVKDDGNGVPPGDCLLMALPHYTSKITGFSDLEKIQSYGFRGEALHSLCNVASVTVITKTDNDDVARVYVFDDTGKVVESKVSHGLKGTTVIVTGLFKNLPVRKQVMSSGKRVNEELKKIERVVKALAVVHPKVRVILVHNKFLIWQKTRVAHLKLSVLQMVSATIVKQLHHMIYNTDQMNFELLIPKHGCDIHTMCTGTAGESFNIFVNKRPVRDSRIEKALSESFSLNFGSSLPSSKFPICFLAITIPPDLVDVNLEPNKTKVLIKDQDVLLDCLKEQLCTYYIENTSEPNLENCSDNINVKLNGPILKRNNSNKSPLKSKSPLKAKIFKSVSNDQVEKKRVGLFDGDKECPSIPFVTAGYSEATVLKTDLQSENDSDNSGNNNNNNVISSGSCQSSIGSDNLTLTLNNQDLSTPESLTASINPEEIVLSQSLSSSNSVESTEDKTLQPINVEKDSLGSSTILRSDRCEEISLSQWSKGIIFNNRTDQSLIPETDNLDKEKGKIGNNIKESIKYITKNQDYCDINKTNNEFMDPNEDNQLIEACLSVNEPYDTADENVNNFVAQVCNMKQSTIVDNFHLENYKINDKECGSANLSRYTESCASKQMGRIEMSAFTQFAREMRSEILKETPGMSFTTVASTLANKWKDLQEDEKQKYEKITNVDKRKNALVPDGIVQMKKQKLENPGIDISIDMLREKISKSNLSIDTFCVIGQIEKSDLWAYRTTSDNSQNEIGVISATRLQQAVQYYKNKESMILPSVELVNRFLINECDLDSTLWKVLISLECIADDKEKKTIIIDNRLIKNGFKVILEEGTNGKLIAYITDVAARLSPYGIDDLREILRNIDFHGPHCSVKQSRSFSALKYIRDETIRLSRNREEKLVVNIGDVTKQLEFWLNNCDKCVCPHGKDVAVILHTYCGND